MESVKHYMVKLIRGLQLLLFIGFLGGIISILIDAPAHMQWLEDLIIPDGQLATPWRVIISVQVLLLLFVLWLEIVIRSLLSGSAYKLNFIDGVSLVVIGVVIVVFYAKEFINPLQILYIEDGLLENATALFAFISASLLIQGAGRRQHVGAKIVLGGLALFFFVFAMEEISWGQRIFGWETPEQWKEVNYQEETNLHNLLNPAFDLIYVLFNIGLSLLLIFCRRIQSSIRDYSASSEIVKLLPGKAAGLYFIPFSFLIIHALNYSGGELTEQVLAVAGLAYSIKQRSNNAK